MSYSLRPATEDDLPRIVEIEAAVHVAPWSGSQFHAEMEKPYCQVLVMTDDETDSVIAGYIVFWLMIDECQILNIVVEPQFRGQGLALQMMRKTISNAARAGMKRAILEVRRSNQPAIQLYQKLGFTITSVRKAFYSNGEDAYQMTLPLEGERVEF